MRRGRDFRARYHKSRRPKRVNLFIIAGRIIVLASCGLISLFLCMSGYESIYNRDLPFVHTLDAVDMTAYDKRYDLPNASQPSAAMFGSFGKPQTLKLPERALRLDVVPPIFSNDHKWLARANTMHLLIVKPPRSGNLGMVMLYCRSSFRTIAAENLPKLGENIFMDTDTNWRYIYRVSNIKLAKADEPFVVSDDGQNGKLIVTCNDAAQKTNTVVEATLLSVQGVVQ